MRHLLRLRCAWLALALAACGPRPPRSADGAVVAVTATSGARFERPANWPARETHGEGSSFLLVEPGDVERFAVCRLADTTSDLAALDAKLQARVAAAQPDVESGPPTPVTIARRPALRRDITLPAGRHGVRCVITGGWLVEYQFRDGWRGTVEPAFQAMLAGLELP